MNKITYNKFKNIGIITLNNLLERSYYLYISKEIDEKNTFHEQISTYLECIIDECANYYTNPETVIDILVNYMYNSPCGELTLTFIFNAMQLNTMEYNGKVVVKCNGYFITMQSNLPKMDDEPTYSKMCNDIYHIIDNSKTSPFSKLYQNMELCLDIATSIENKLYSLYEYIKLNGEHKVPDYKNLLNSYIEKYCMAAHEICMEKNIEELLIYKKIISPRTIFFNVGEVRKYTPNEILKIIMFLELVK